MEKFSQSVVEKIGYYVYYLQDPRNNKIFYIGKGKGNRIFQHIKGAIKNSNETDKLNLIRKIGPNKVKHFILKYGLTENEALLVESACIELIGLEELKNAIEGFNSQLSSVDEIVQKFEAKIITISEPTIIITINRLYERHMSEKDLYRVTRKRWKVGTKRNNTKYAIAAYRGLVREVYKIDKWSKCKNGRWGFTGTVAEDKIRNKYLNQSLEKYVGTQNPIRYTF